MNVRLFVRLIALVFLASFVNLFAQSSVVTFADQNFEKTIRRYIEHGWMWVSGYSGTDYQFKENDLRDMTWLSFDESDLPISSLSDLQWFPNLNSLQIWDASQITDFSPLWEFSDQVLYLAINGSRGVDLSGISSMSALESLDLDDNQLTDLSLLGEYPNLIQLNLVGNFLDLGEASISQKLESLSAQIENKRNSLGIWWGDSIEYTPQYPEGFKNLSSETSRVEQILLGSPNDAEANLLRGLYQMLNIFENTDTKGLKEFAVSVGVDSSIRNFVLSDLPMLENYDTELNNDLQLDELAELFEQSIIPSLESADASFSMIPSSSLIQLDEELTGSESTVTVDYADTLVLRTITNLFAGLLSLQSGYNWDMNAGHMEELDDSEDMSVEQIRNHNSNFGGIRSTEQLNKAKAFFQTAIDLYQIASPLLRNDSRLDIDDRLFVLSSMDLEEEADFLKNMQELEKSLAGPSDLFGDGEDAEMVDLSALLGGKVDLAELLPENVGDQFSTYEFEDPTMGGLFPDFTSQRIFDEFGKYDVFFMDADDDGLSDEEEIFLGTSPYDSDTDQDGLPDKVEVDAGLNPLYSDGLVVETTLKYYSLDQNTSRTNSNPYTFNWYFQPQVGWMWTHEETFPYIYQKGSTNEPGSWLYFEGRSANPIRFYDFGKDGWISLGN